MKKMRSPLPSMMGAMLWLSVTSAFAATAKTTAGPKTVVVPSDAKVLELARKNGAKMTTRGLVQPQAALKPVATGQARVPITLSPSEKKIPSGKAEKPLKTRGGGGYAYIFIKPQNLAGLGHIGWAYWAPNQNYYVGGSTENNPGYPFVPNGGDNGYWSEAFNDESGMFQKFKNMGYYAYKRKWVSSTNPDTAWARACYTRATGFRGLTWNCLDHTYYILEGYGASGMPWKQTNPAPTGWFNAFPGTSYRLP